MSCPSVLSHDGITCDCVGRSCIWYSGGIVVGEGGITVPVADGCVGVTGTDGEYDPPPPPPPAPIYGRTITVRLIVDLFPALSMY